MLTTSRVWYVGRSTGGGAERFNRALKAQAIYNRIFQNLEEVREAFDAFVKRYNAHWRLEKPDFQNPLEARKAVLRKEDA